MIWLIQVRDGKLLDEMAVSMTGLATKVGLLMLHPSKNILLRKEQPVWYKFRFQCSFRKPADASAHIKHPEPQEGGFATMMNVWTILM